MKCLIILLTVSIFSIFAKKLQYTFETKFIEVPVDHFSYTTNLTFKLRYLVNDTFHVERGPIFFYTGNEGNVNAFAQNTGFIFDIAPLFNALIVFAEHRYYGMSLPFGNLTFSSPKYLGYLSSSQALSDYVYLINDLQESYGTKDLRKLPVVAFGGSYGGMLAAWIRIKYPASVLGAIASSAPIWQFKDLTPCENFNRIATGVYTALGGGKCSQTIRDSWQIIRSQAKDDVGKAALSKIWNLCSVLKTDDDINTLVDWLTNIYSNLAMVNYPYPTSFIKPLPGNPVRAFCGKINSYEYKNNSGLLLAIGKGLNLYTNYTQGTKCNNINESDDLGSSPWLFQSCTEMIMPMCSTDLDMFENEKWDFKKFSDTCLKTLGVRPRDEESAVLEYGGKILKYASNIVFSNGLLDPWSSGGVLRNITSKVVAVIISDGAHHFDLRGSNLHDPESVKSARKFHIHEIERWLNTYYLENIQNPGRYKIEPLVML